MSRIAAGGAEAAIEPLQKALAIYADWWPEDYWRADLVRVDLGAALVRSGDPATGRSHLAKSADSLEWKLGADHPETRRAMAFLEEFDASN